MVFNYNEIDFIKIDGEYYKHTGCYDDENNMHCGSVDIGNHIIYTKHRLKPIVQKNLIEMAKFQLKLNSNKDLNELINQQIFFNN